MNTNNHIVLLCIGAVLMCASLSIASDTNIPDEVVRLRAAIVSSENQEAKTLAHVRLLIELGNRLESPANPELLKLLAESALATVALPSENWAHPVGAYYRTALASFEGRKDDAVNLAKGYLVSLPFSQLQKEKNRDYQAFLSALGDGPDPLRDAFVLILGCSLCDLGRHDEAEKLVEQIKSPSFREVLGSSINQAKNPQ